MELLRVVLMLFIVGHHVLIHGAGLYDPPPLAFAAWLRLAINCVFVGAVDCFVFVSGFFGIHLRSITLIKLASQCWFYAIILGGGFVLLGWAKWDENVPWLMLLPITSGLWWFVSCYALLMILSPLLNRIGQGLDKRHLLAVIGVLFVCEAVFGYYDEPPNLWGGSGYLPMNFVLLYMMAMFLRRFHRERPLGVYLLVWLGAVGALFLVVWSLVHAGQADRIWYRAFAYNSPLVILSAVSFFFVFKRVKNVGPWVYGVSPLVLGVYLLHDHLFVRAVLYAWVFRIDSYRDSWLFFALLPLIILGIFSSGILVERLRVFLFQGLEHRASQLPIFRSVDRLLRLKPEVKR